MTNTNRRECSREYNWEDNREYKRKFLPKFQRNSSRKSSRKRKLDAKAFFAALFISTAFASSAIAQDAPVSADWQSVGSYALGDVTANIEAETSLGTLTWAHSDDVATTPDKMMINDRELPIATDRMAQETQVYMMDLGGSLLVAELVRSETGTCLNQSGLLYVTKDDARLIGYGCTERFISNDVVDVYEDKLVVDGVDIPFETSKPVEINDES